MLAHEFALVWRRGVLIDVQIFLFLLAIYQFCLMDSESRAMQLDARIETGFLSKLPVHFLPQ